MNIVLLLFMVVKDLDSYNIVQNEFPNIKYFIINIKFLRGNNKV